MMLVTIVESPAVGGGAKLPSRPSTAGDFDFHKRSRVGEYDSRTQPHPKAPMKQGVDSLEIPVPVLADSRASSRSNPWQSGEAQSSILLRDGDSYVTTAAGISFFFLLCLTAFSALRMEIAPGIPGYPVMVRVVSDATNYPPEQLFWIERRDDTNTWWDEEIRTPTNTWWYCGTKASNAIFRAKPMP